MADVVALIDGFNMYHALDVERGNGRPYQQSKWINYWKLAECFQGADGVLKRVVLFTAYLPDDEPWEKEKNARHASLVAANKASGVDVILGRFLKRRVDFNVRPSELRLSIPKLEEKRTDVNIAVTLAGLAYDAGYDRLLLFTADSDLIPAVEEAKRRHAAGDIVIVPPIERHGIAKALIGATGKSMRMTNKHLAASRLPHTVVVDQATGQSVTCPQEWEQKGPRL
jgi:uncharacterized LabA/DUF88 family protein